MIDELQAWDLETKRLQNELDAFLKKFDDIDLLLHRANAQVLHYFKKQIDFTNLDDFKAFLKKEIEFYFGTFGMPRSEKRLIRERIIDIEENYNKILYFGERNPVEERDKHITKAVKPSFLNRIQCVLNEKVKGN